MKFISLGVRKVCVCALNKLGYTLYMYKHTQALNLALPCVLQQTNLHTLGKKCYCKHPCGPLQLLYKELVCVTQKCSAAAVADVWI